MYTIRAYYLQYCGSYAPHRRRWTPDAGRWTLDAGPSTPYYKLTGELKINNMFLKLCFLENDDVGGWLFIFIF